MKRIDLELAQETLRAAITRARQAITVESVIKTVASCHGLAPSDIKSERRHESIATPRAVAMHMFLAVGPASDQEPHFIHDLQAGYVQSRPMGRTVTDLPGSYFR